MNEAFSDRKAQIFVVEPNDDLRQAIGGALTELGFENNLRFGSLGEVIPLLRADNIPDLLIAPLCAEGEVNAFHFLDYFVRTEKCHRCRIVLLLEDTEKYCLRVAFQMGILSWLPRELGSITSSLKELLKTMEAYDWDTCLTAYDYIMQILLAEADHEDMEQLVKRLILIHEDAAAVNLRYAECLLSQGLIPRGLMILRHIEATTEGYEAATKILRETYVKEEIPDEQELTFAASHGITNVIVVDPDEANLNSLNEILGRLGVENINVFTDGESAWDHMTQSSPPELIIMEWKIPRISGAGLLQRIRVESRIDVPVIIYSAVVTEKDRLLLREMGVTDIIQKPLYEKLLIEELKTTIIHEYTDSDIVSMERKIRAKLRAKDLGGAGTLLESLEQNPRVPANLKEHLQAELYLYKGEVLKAKDLAIQSLHTWGETPLLLDLIGKILLNMREYGLSKIFFDKAAGLIPGNIERLCALAETNIELGDAEEAAENLEEAERIDQDSEIIDETKATLAIQQGDIDLAQKIMARIPHSENVVARLNNKAVYMVNQDQLEEAVTLYERALEALDNESQELRAIVYYNMGLGQAKQGELTRSQASLSQSVSIEESRVFPRAKSLHGRVKKSLEAGRALVLNTKRDGEDSTDCFVPITVIQHSGPLPMSPTGKPGSLCCHIIYQSKKPIDERALGLFQKPPLSLMTSDEGMMTIT